jgi:hypothetical protein
MTAEVLTNYLDIPLSHALVAKYGPKLEALTAPDKLDIAHSILTTIAWADNQGTPKTVGETVGSFGGVMEAATQSEAAIGIIDAHQNSTEDLLGLAALLCLHLQMGLYADAQ